MDVIQFADCVQNAVSNKTHLFSVGQAGFIFRSRSGYLLGLDLYLSECVERVEGNIGFKRLLPKILDPAQLKFDGIIATHFHSDHFDQDSIPTLMANGHTQLYAAVDCQIEIQNLGVPAQRITYVKSGSRCKCGDFTLDFVSCDHGTAAPDAVGVLISVDNKNIYVAGDSSLRLDHTAEFLQNGPIDLMIAPINGAFGNMDEEECARFSAELKPHLTIPCHYGMFASHGGNPGKFYQIMQECYPERDVLLMCMGEQYTFE